VASWIGIVLFVVGLGAAIALHEWGHLVTAKRYGMRADRYFIGFGPTIWSTQRGETEYGVKWLFFGGFVRIRGMSPTDERLRPVAEAVFDRDLVAADRREAAGAGGSLDNVPALPHATWQRLEEELRSRGVPDDDRAWLVERTRAEAGQHATAREAAVVFTALAGRRLEQTGRVGDVRHRVLRGDEGRFFHDRPAWQRAIVLSAGSAMHFVIAIVLLFVAFWAFEAVATTTVEEVIPGTPAAEAELVPGERIIAVDGVAVATFDETRELLASRPGETVSLRLASGDAVREIQLTTGLAVAAVEVGSDLAETGIAPRDRIIAVDGTPVEGIGSLRDAASREEVTLTVARDIMTADGQITATEEAIAIPGGLVADLEESLIGLAGFRPAHESVGVVGAAKMTFFGEGSFPSMVVMTFEAFGGLFGPEGLGAIPAQLLGGERDIAGSSLASPVGLAQIAGQGTATAGLFFLLAILAAINVFIGIFNLLPLPPLDGGHLAVLAVERSVNAVRSWRGLTPDYRVDPRTISAIALPVIVLLGALFVAVLVLDITNPLRLPQ
jgi:regulator of sigma E protease